MLHISLSVHGTEDHVTVKLSVHCTEDHVTHFTVKLSPLFVDLVTFLCQIPSLLYCRSCYPYVSVYSMITLFFKATILFMNHAS